MGQKKEVTGYMYTIYKYCIRITAVIVATSFTVRFPARYFFIFFFCSFSPAIFGAQRLNPRGGRNTGMFPVGCFSFLARMDMANEEK